MYPKSFEDAVSGFEKLPSVGNKTAQRYVFSLMKMSHEELHKFAQACEGLSELKRCHKCGFLCSEELCTFCQDESRDHKSIMVVSYDQDAAAIENTNGYHGLYHILNGVISSVKGVYPEDLNIESLLSRLQDVKEVIIATPFTMEGEMTAMYLDRLLKQQGVLVTRLAHGLPMGANLDYADEWTLLKAMDNRKSLEE